MRTVLKKLHLTPISTILLGSAGGQGAVLLASPLLTRIYGPEAFGSLAVLTAFASICSVAATLRWEAGISVPSEEAHARAMAWMGLLSATIFCIIIAAILLIWPSLVIAVAGEQSSRFYWWLLPVTIAAVALNKVCSAWMVRQEAYSALGHRNLLQGFGQLAVQVGLGLMKIKPLGLLLGLAAGRVASLGGLAGSHGLFNGLIPSRRDIRVVAARYKRYPLITSWGSFLNALGLQAPILILSASYGAMAFGMVALTIRVLATPVGIISDAVALNYEGRLGSAIRVGQQDFLKGLFTTIRRLALVAVLPSLVIVTLGPQLFSFVFGSEWTSAGELARIMIATYAMQFITSPVSRTLLLLQKQWVQAMWESMRMIAVIGAVSYSTIIDAELVHAVVLLTIAHVVSYLALLLLTVHYARSSGHQISVRQEVAESDG